MAYFLGKCAGTFSAIFLKFLPQFYPGLFKITLILIDLKNYKLLLVFIYRFYHIPV